MYFLSPHQSRLHAPGIRNRTTDMAPLPAVCATGGFVQESCNATALLILPVWESDHKTYSRWGTFLWVSQRVDDSLVHTHSPARTDTAGLSLTRAAPIGYCYRPATLSTNPYASAQRQDARRRNRSCSQVWWSCIRWQLSLTFESRTQPVSSILTRRTVDAHLLGRTPDRASRSRARNRRRQ